MTVSCGNTLRGKIGENFLVLSLPSYTFTLPFSPSLSFDSCRGSCIFLLHSPHTNRKEIHDEKKRWRSTRLMIPLICTFYILHCWINQAVPFSMVSHFNNKFIFFFSMNHVVYFILCFFLVKYSHSKAKQIMYPQFYSNVLFSVFSPFPKFCIKF